jgi:hemoglobin
MTLFEKLGGEQAVSAVVGKFYELMLQDSRVSHFSQGINLGLLKCRQKQSITLVTGGQIHMKALI